MKRLRLVCTFALMCCIGSAVFAQSKTKPAGAPPAQDDEQQNTSEQKGKKGTKGTSTGGHENGSLSTYRLSCASSDGRSSCTQGQLDKLAQSCCVHRPPMHISLSSRADGTISCTLTNGESCDDGLLQAIIDQSSSSGSSIVLSKAGDSSDVDVDSPRPKSGKIRESPTKESLGATTPDTVDIRESPSKASLGKNSGHASEKLRESPTLPSRPKGSAAVIHRDLACRNVDGQSACTQAQLDQLLQSMAKDKNYVGHVTLIKRLMFNPKEYSITCTQTSGEECDDAQLQAILDLSSNSGLVVLTTSSVSADGFNHPPIITDKLRESPTLPSRPKGSAAASFQLACRNADGQSACSDAQLRDISTGVCSGKRQHSPVSMGLSLKITSPDGSMVCTQSDGKACSDEQLQAVVDNVTECAASVHVNKIEALTVKQ